MGIEKAVINNIGLAEGLLGGELNSSGGIEV
jgi:hypothetical protein